MASISTIIQRRIVILNINSSAQEAARALRDNEVGCVLVGDSEGKLSGIVTDRDLACRLVADDVPGDTPISSIMTHEVATARDDARISDLTRIMEAHGVRRIPIVSSDPKKPHCVGIVTLDDLLCAGQVELSAVERIVRRQTSRRAETEASSPRSEAHAQQTLERFYRTIGRVTDLPPNLVPSLSYVILSNLVRRLSSQAAAHFVAQLPKYLQGALLHLPPGPDRHITTGHVTEELVSRFQFREKYARFLLQSFCYALSHAMDAHQIELLAVRLPADFRALFATKVQSAAEAPAPVLRVSSPVFSDSGIIPIVFTGEGANRTPPLRWSQVPRGTHEFTVVCEDIDSKPRPWTHWVAYGIPANVTQLPEGLPAHATVELPVRLRQGRNSAGTTGYEGPMPARGSDAHRYEFRVYALDREITLPPGATQEELLLEMKGHILAEGAITARYARAQAPKPVKVA